MHGRSTKQRRSAMRRRQAEKGRCTMAQFQSALNALHDAGRLVPFARPAFFTVPPGGPSFAYVGSYVPPKESPFRTLVYAETPKETK